MSQQSFPHVQASGATSRWSVLDTFRGLAVLLMIQGHTFTELARKSEFSGSWVRLYRLSHGLTAPMFLVGGGLAYGMVSVRRRAQAPSARWDARIVRRAFTLLLVGYLLQWPQLSLAKLSHNPQALRVLFAVGPLQLVGVCLLLSECAWAICRARALYLAALSAAASGIAVCSPWIWMARPSEHTWLPVGTWLDGYSGSFFPFFPWAVFFLLGVVVSGFVPWAQRAPRAAASVLTLGGLGSASVLFVVWQAGEDLSRFYGDHEFWHAGPMYLAFRALLVLTMLGGLVALEPTCNGLRRLFPTAGRLFDTLSRQSLVAYVTHLLVLYGTPFTTGIVRFGRVFSLSEATLIFVGIASYTLAIVVLWDHAKPADLLGRHWRRLRGTQVHRVGESKGTDVRPAEQDFEPPPSIHHG